MAVALRMFDRLGRTTVEDGDRKVLAQVNLRARGGERHYRARVVGHVVYDGPDLDALVAEVKRYHGIAEEA
jgi:hypothetical protein